MEGWRAANEHGRKLVAYQHAQICACTRLSSLIIFPREAFRKQMRREDAESPLLVSRWPNREI